MDNPIEKLTSLGQSLWYDNIERRLLENGELEGLIRNGEIRGLTSNPSIFQNAIARSTDYDSALASMAWAGLSTSEIFENLAIEDIRAAADLLLPVYFHSEGVDGYVSLEVNPELAYDTESTLSEVRRLWNIVDRPNLMIKIPATKPGLPAVRQAILEGININITLIFSITRYLEVMNAYLEGLEQRALDGKPVDRIASVASFFVSRIDTKVDQRLEVIVHKETPDSERALALLGKIAVANAKLAYKEFRRVFNSERFEKLKQKGARVQRPLWASTSTKNPAYPDTLYVDELIGPDTVNTVPPNTLSAFRNHGNARLSVESDIEQVQQQFDELERLGISIELITAELEQEGVQAFARAYETLLSVLEKRRQEAVRQLGNLAEPVSRKIDKLVDSKFVERLFQNDAELWTMDPDGQKEIRIRLGWLNLPESSRPLISDLRIFSKEILDAGFTHAMLLGMGGSSLAPETLSRIFSSASETGKTPGLDLAILDSTDPDQVLAAAVRSELEKTLFIVSSKSGGTAEVMAFLDYFWAKAQKEIGERAGDQFIAITDPGSSLAALAQKRNFRKVFLADPNVGGRYSALTAFGLVPAALMGIDVERLLDSALWMSAQCQSETPEVRNPGLVLGAIVGVAAADGRDKLTLIADSLFAPFGAWLEQLIAESSGKSGVGVVPVDGEPVASPPNYKEDRMFVYLRDRGEYDTEVEQLIDAGFPVIVLPVHDPYDLGAEFYRWEYATAVACSILGVNAFDQPNVQDAKTSTNAKIRAFQEQGKFGEGDPAWQDGNVQLFTTPVTQALISGKEHDLAEALSKYLRTGKAGDYISVNAYLQRNTDNEQVLRNIQATIRDRTKLATTLGFGPRFLHSTGQLHKGGANNGLFLVITSEHAGDVIIPERGISFANLELGQALGDMEALQARDRRVLRLHLVRQDMLAYLLQALQAL